MDMWEESIVRFRKVGFLRGEAVRRIKVEVYEQFSEDGNSCLQPFTCCLRVPGGAMGIEISHDDVIKKVIKKVKVWNEIGRTG